MDINRHARSLLVLSTTLFLGFGSGAALVAGQAAPAQAQPAAQAQAPAKDAVPGVRNFTKIDATFACGGALTPEAFAAVKQAGFVSVVNLRAANEQGVNIEADQKAAQDAGLKYYHLPFVVATPDSTKIDEFLKLVAAPANQPMLLHCASGGRASLFWAAKRVMIDGWTVEKAMNETDLAKNANPAARTAVLDYLKAHGKGRP
jgi:tyrosine-protein phosphatase SIW14